MSDNKNIPATKQLKRLFEGPLDPTSSWSSMEELSLYLKSPTCYSNQIVTCEDKAYIIVERDGAKVLLELGSGKSSSGMHCGCDFTELWKEIANKAEKSHKHKFEDLDLDVLDDIIYVPGYHIGPTPPTDTTLIWMDTSDGEIDNQLSKSKIVNDFKKSVTSLKKYYDYLKEKMENIRYCINNGQTIPELENSPDVYIPSFDYIQDNPPFTTDFIDILTTSEGEPILTSYGDYLLTGNTNNTTYDGYILTTSEGEPILTSYGDYLLIDAVEDNKDDIDVLSTNLGMPIITSSGDYLLTGDTKDRQYEGDLLTTKIGLPILTKSGDYLLINRNNGNKDIDILSSNLGDPIVTSSGDYLLTGNTKNRKFNGNILTTNEGDPILSNNGGYILLNDEDDITTYSDDSDISVVNDTKPVSTPISLFSERADVNSDEECCEECTIEKERIRGSLTLKADLKHRHKPNDFDRLPDFSDKESRMKYHIGKDQPEDNSVLWVDTSDTTISEDLIESILKEVTSSLESLNNGGRDIKVSIQNIIDNYNKNK